MLEHVFPKGERFRLAVNEHRSLGTTMRAHIRQAGLLRAFGSRSELRRALDIGEIWTMQSDSVRAASSFVELLRHAGRDVPAIFDGIAPPLPRHDQGLVLTYDATLSKSWQLEYRRETRAAITILRGPTFAAVMQRALDLECERARSTAEAFVVLHQSPMPSISYLH